MSGLSVLILTQISFAAGVVCTLGWQALWRRTRRRVREEAQTQNGAGEDELFLQELFGRRKRTDHD
ncbi:hypothetical protein [Rhizobium halophilum]|uniref:hypothetical protein n=1 Tax=Rhizobium halophilum TaxID=2846852 RepID=UPI001EFDD7D1|nr:hypothetical protein [Rhizobium halophilum]MCF6368307.1 hypothetical protein [Rhizobium halophilum]